MLSDHAIWMLFWNTMCDSGCSGVICNTHAKFYLPSSFTNARQNPSCVSAFENNTDSDLGAVDVSHITLGSACPMFYNASSGAIITVVWFNDGFFTLLNVI